MKKPNRRKPLCEALEARLCLSSTAAAAGSKPHHRDGIDSIALGDVNGDEVADIAVASHRGGKELVTIYSGDGRAASGKQDGSAALPLLVLTNPLGADSGPLSVALGDFAGTGTAQLAIAPSSKSAAATGRGILVESFHNNDGSTPADSTVSAQPMGGTFVPAGMDARAGFALAAAIDPATGVAGLVVAPAAAGGPSITVNAYQPASASWQVARTIGRIPVDASKGLGVAAGDATGDGVADVAVASAADGSVAIFDGQAGTWGAAQQPLGAGARHVQVAITPGKAEPGGLVAAGTVAGKHAIVAWNYGTAGATPPAPTALPAEPGTAGSRLVLAGGGMVYQRSTLAGLGTKSPTSAGPITPTVLIGATTTRAKLGAAIVVQGFAADGTPSPGDTNIEHLDAKSHAGFVPLQPRTDAAVTRTTATATASPSSTTAASRTAAAGSTALIAMPATAWQSPYSIDLAAAPPGFDAGLFPRTVDTTTMPNQPWGPDRGAPNAPPKVTAATTNDDLRERLLEAYQQAIGVDYQHHHLPFWQPAQGSEWNAVGTVGSQSEGVDCSNLVAWAYDDALGIKIPSAIGTLGKVSGQDEPSSEVSIPAALKGHAAVATIDRSQWLGSSDPAPLAGPAATAAYDKLVALLRPGDLLIVDGDGVGTPQHPGAATHVITWLGKYGVDANKADANLVIDSTGMSWKHIDSNGHAIPEGVQVRPFGAPGTANDWYFAHVDHVLRLLDPTP